MFLKISIVLLLTYIATSSQCLINSTKTTQEFNLTLCDLQSASQLLECNMTYKVINDGKGAMADTTINGIYFFNGQTYELVETLYFNSISPVNHHLNQQIKTTFRFSEGLKDGDYQLLTKLSKKNCNQFGACSFDIRYQTVIDFKIKSGYLEKTRKIRKQTQMQ